MKIAYLSADYAANLDYENAEGNKEKAVLEDQHKEIFTLEEFVQFYNDQYVSSMGFIAIIKEKDDE